MSTKKRKKLGKANGTLDLMKIFYINSVNALFTSLSTAEIQILLMSFEFIQSQFHAQRS